MELLHIVMCFLLNKQYTSFSLILYVFSFTSMLPINVEQLVRASVANLYVMSSNPGGAFIRSFTFQKQFRCIFSEILNR